MNHHYLQALLSRIRGASGQNQSAEATDADLLNRWLEQHDEAAFELIVWRHGGLVLDLCRRVLTLPADVDDAFQATFLILVRKAGSVRQRASLSSWLYKVAWRIALAARARSGRRRTGELAADMAAAPAGEDPFNYQELREAVAEEIHRLPERYRAPLVLCCLQGLTVDQAASAIGCARWTLATRLARAKDRLRRNLARRDLALAGVGFGSLLVTTEGAAAAPATLVRHTAQASSAFAGRVASDALSPAAVALAQSALSHVALGQLATLCGLFLLGIVATGTAWSYWAKPQGAPDLPMVPAEVVAAISELPSFLDPDPAPVPANASEQPLSQEALKVARLGEGQRVTLAWPAGGEGPSKEVVLRYDDATQIQFSWVSRGKAAPEIGYQAARTFVSSAEKDRLTRVHFNGHQRYQRDARTRSQPEWQGTIVEVLPNGEIILESHPEKQPARRISLLLTPETAELYFRVSPGGAEPRIGYRATIWLVEGSEQAAAHAFFSPL